LSRGLRDLPWRDPLGLRLWRAVEKRLALDPVFELGIMRKTAVSMRLLDRMPLACHMHRQPGAVQRKPGDAALVLEWSAYAGAGAVYDLLWCHDPPTFE
jgi:hypothetical protein